MRLTLDACAFLELSGDDVIDPDAAVAQMEAIANRLHELSEEERQEFSSYIDDLASRERAAGRDEEWITFLETFMENMGLIGDEGRSSAPL
jgi:hypothetical protein